MGAAYSFVSVWTVDAAPQRCWTELERTLHPGSPTWWRSLRIAEAPERIAVGEPIVLDVRSPLGYRLRPRLVLTEVDPGRAIGVESSGDLRGTGRIELSPVGVGSRIEIHWDVVTERRWMNATAFALRPVFAWAHARVMAEGERGLRAAVG